MLSAAAFVAAIFVTAAAFRPESTPNHDSYEPLAPSVAFTSPPTTERADAGSRRLVYRHSVIPGGVYSDGELRAAMRSDPVVAAHFTTLGRTRLRTEIVPHDRMVYVSYRKGNDIYWTRHTVLLRAGETILTDGRTQIRTRCGNCISDEPVTPVADAEPDIVEFDALVEDPAEEGTVVAEAPPGEVVTNAPSLTAGGGQAAGHPAPSGAAPFVFPAAGPAPFVRWGGLEAIPPSTHEQPTTPVAQPAADDPQPSPPEDHPPADDPPAADDPPLEPPDDDTPLEPEINPVPVPEPSTYLLVGGGIAALLRRMRGRNNARRTTTEIDG